MTVAAKADADDLAEVGRKLFAGECQFIWAGAKADELPPLGPAEIAFAGRSNVGKSSLLNALTGRKALARTSHTPGRTQQLNFFDIGAEPVRLRVIDMPGYGYAAVSKEKIANWTGVMHDYLRGRPSLARVVLLLDARVEVKESDSTVMDLLDGAAVIFQIVLTKVDAVKPPRLADKLAEAHALARAHAAAYPDVVATSSETGDGIPALRASLARLAREYAAEEHESEVR